MSLNNIFDIAGSGMSAQSLRLNTTASNLANAQSGAGKESDVYKARHPIFATMQRDLMAQAMSDGIFAQRTRGQ